MPTHQKCGEGWSGYRVQHCPACCLTFSGTTAGDAHRVGDWEPRTTTPRRCLTVDEMTERGMKPNAYGYWGMGETYDAPSAP